MQKNSVVPRYPQGPGPRTPSDTKTRGWSRPLYEMLQYLPITYHILLCTLNHLWFAQIPNTVQAVVILGRLGTNGKGKSLYVFSTDTVMAQVSVDCMSATA